MGLDMKIRHWVGLIVGLVAVMLTPLTAFADAHVTYYARVETQTITRGVTLETKKMVTSDGLLDVYTLRVPLDDKNIRVEPILSQTELGLKETTAKILSDAGAVAGVNGDFFGMVGDYSVPLGIYAEEGHFAGSVRFNNPKLESATFYADYFGGVFMDYLTLDFKLYIENKEVVEVASYNKLANIDYPVILTSHYAPDSADLDKRFKAVKILVSNGRITHIAKAGELCRVSADGFMLVLNESTYARFASELTVGKSAILSLQPSIDITAVKSALSGGGKILANGVAAPVTGAVANGRHPRTALGLSRDKKTLIMMVVDGRTHSIGASPSEMVQLMLDAGAYDAMHLDGGGSSAMVIGGVNGETAKMVNTPSEGYARKVINALGVFVDAPLGAIVKLGIDAPDVVPIGGYADVKVYGLDAYNRRVEIPAGDVRITSANAWSEGSRVYAQNTGTIEVYATYGAFTSSKKLAAETVTELIPSISVISASAGEVVNFTVTGITETGRRVNIPLELLTREVSDGLGTLTTNYTAIKQGNGYVKLGLGGAVSYIPILTLTEKPIDLNMLFGHPTFAAYPETVTGLVEAAYSQPGQIWSGAKLSYAFAASESTQAAYLTIDPIKLPDGTKSIKMTVLGDNSGHWLRGRIVDAAGKEHVVDFAKTIDFVGTKDLTAELPAGVAFPAYLTRVYVASLAQSAPSNNAVAFYNIFALSPDLAQVNVPKNVIIPDKRVLDVASAQVAPLQVERKTAGGFATAKFGEILYVNLDTSAGGVAASDGSQYNALNEALKTAKYVVINTELPLGAFKTAKEAELLKSIFADYSKTTQILYIHQNSANTARIEDNVRYIGLSGGRVGIAVKDGLLSYGFVTVQ